MAETHPHDPGIEVAHRRAEEAGDFARSPIKVDEFVLKFAKPK